MPRTYLLILALILFVCGSLPARSAAEVGLMPEPPAIQVTANGTDIPTAVGLNIWNGAIYDRIGTFQMIAHAHSEFPYIALGTQIEIRLDGEMPDQYELCDYVLTADGSFKYETYVSLDPIPFELADGAGSFKLPGNVMTMLSSNSADYEQGASIRGFMLTCFWGENSCEYGFMLRTDAGM